MNMNIMINQEHYKQIIRENNEFRVQVGEALTLAVRASEQARQALDLLKDAQALNRELLEAVRDGNRKTLEIIEGGYQSAGSEVV